MTLCREVKGSNDSLKQISSTNARVERELIDVIFLRVNVSLKLSIIKSVPPYSKVLRIGFAFVIWRNTDVPGTPIKNHWINYFRYGRK